MQFVSQAWKNAQRKTLVPESFVEISIKIVDPEAQADASVTTNGAEFFATPEEITGDNVAPVKYAMLEPGLWPLDGTCYLVGGDWEPSEPALTYAIFIPAGETTALRTADRQEVYIKE